MADYHYRDSKGAGAASPLFVVFHGTGGDENQFFDLAGQLLAGARIAESALDAVDGADAVVLVTEWPEFRELDWTGEVKRRMRVPLVVDGRNFLDRDELERAGFTYEGIGR